MEEEVLVEMEVEARPAAEDLLSEEEAQEVVEVEARPEAEDLPSMEQTSLGVSIGRSIVNSTSDSCPSGTVTGKLPSSTFARSPSWFVSRIRWLWILVP
jgi:hypothetical protein